MMKKTSKVVALLVMIVVLSVSVSAVFLRSWKLEASPATQNFTYTVVNTYPHDSSAFTEGLFYADGFFFESTGLRGFSSLRRVNLTSGEVLQKISLSSNLFGEGIALVNNTIIQLTYQAQVGFVYNKDTFDLIRNFTYSTEGWGLTYDGEYLIMSDGSSNLYFLNSTTFQTVKQVQVHEGNISVPMLNELEFINGDIYANIFGQQKIAIINPETGQVKSWVDLNGLGLADLGGENVLNGIAYDSKNNMLFVTGKDWSKIYEIKLVPLNG